MDSVVENRLEVDLVSKITSLSFEKGWITGVQARKVESKTTLTEKKLELFELLKTMESDEDAMRLLCAIRCIKEVNYTSNKSGVDEHPFSALILSKLLEMSLITQEQQLEFERLLHVQNTEKKEHTMLGVSEKVKNPMLLCPVIGRVLKYLSLQDIKNCRLICQEWNSVAQPVLRTRSRIKFLKNETGSTTFHPSKFLEDFSSKQEAMPFTAFRISGFSHQFSWAVEDISEFFLSQQENIRGLVLDNLYLTNEGQRVDIFDITPWIVKLPVSRANTKYHTKLEVMGSPRGRVIMQNYALAYVKELSISRCQINLQDLTEFHPSKLTLSDVSFFKDGNKLPEVCINDVVDLSRVKYIHLEYSDHRIENTKLYLDLVGNLKLEYLRLMNIIVTNWRTCTWTVNKLVMDDQAFVKRTEMKIKELHLFFQEIDLSVLPQSLEKLRIHDAHRILCSYSQSVSMDNIQSLALTGLLHKYILIILKHLKFPNLVDLHLEGYNHQLEINSDWISNSVRRLKLRNISINWKKESKDLKLDKLVLTGYSFGDVKKISNFLVQTKELVFHFPDGDEAHENILHFLQYLSGRNYHKCLQRFYVGPFQWSSHFSWEQSPLVDYVNRKAKYYVFENKRGQALDISDDEFEGLEKSNPMYPDVDLVKIVTCK